MQTKEIETVGDILDNLPPVPQPRAPTPPAVVERQLSAITPMAMLQLAVERGADLEMLDKLMSLQQRWEANEARKAYVGAMTSFKAVAPDLVKNKLVAFDNTKYRHATLDQICDAVGPALAQFGLSHRWEVEQAEHDVIRVTCIIMHALGHSERVSLSAKPDTSGKKNAIQAIGSAITYLERYTLTAATGIAAREQDDDGRSAGIATGDGSTGAVIDAKQKDILIDLIRRSETSVKGILGYYKIASIDELPPARFEQARATLLKNLSKKEEGK